MSVLYLLYLIAVPFYVPDPRDVSEEGQTKIVRVMHDIQGVECMVRPLKMAIVLLSVHLLADQCCFTCILST